MLKDWDDEESGRRTSRQTSLAATPRYPSPLTSPSSFNADGLIVNKSNVADGVLLSVLFMISLLYSLTTNRLLSNADPHSSTLEHGCCFRERVVQQLRCSLGTESINHLIGREIFTVTHWKQSLESFVLLPLRHKVILHFYKPSAPWKEYFDSDNGI